MSDVSFWLKCWFHSSIEIRLLIELSMVKCSWFVNLTGKIKVSLYWRSAWCKHTTIIFLEFIRLVIQSRLTRWCSVLLKWRNRSHEQPDGLFVLKFWCIFCGFPLWLRSYLSFSGRFGSCGSRRDCFRCYGLP